MPSNGYSSFTCLNVSKEMVNLELFTDVPLYSQAVLNLPIQVSRFTARNCCNKASKDAKEKGMELHWSNKDEAVTSLVDWL